MPAKGLSYASHGLLSTSTKRSTNPMSMNGGKTRPSGCADQGPTSSVPLT
nr:uncharacterized protein CTRU02_04679 [Colletotrichum truncatum]KAF6795116.1 hypothetical protein CTRU02_04679 [Colletotrichum truncatum]